MFTKLSIERSIMYEVIGCAITGRANRVVPIRAVLKPVALRQRGGGLASLDGGVYGLWGMIYFYERAGLA